MSFFKKIFCNYYKPYSKPQEIWLALDPCVGEKAIAFGEGWFGIRAICVDGECYGNYPEYCVYPR